MEDFSHKNNVTFIQVTAFNDKNRTVRLWRAVAGDSILALACKDPNHTSTKAVV